MPCTLNVPPHAEHWLMMAHPPAIPKRHFCSAILEVRLNKHTCKKFCQSTDESGTSTIEFWPPSSPSACPLSPEFCSKNYVASGVKSSAKHQPTRFLSCSSALFRGPKSSPTPEPHISYSEDIRKSCATGVTEAWEGHVFVVPFPLGLPSAK